MKILSDTGPHGRYRNQLVKLSKKERLELSALSNKGQLDRYAIIHVEHDLIGDTMCIPWNGPSNDIGIEKFLKIKETGFVPKDL